MENKNTEPQEIKDCKDCQDETYPEKYLHYIYLDKDKPSWTCGQHPDYYRKWVCVTNPKVLINLRQSA